jgi:hypothetical protein
MVFGNVYNGTLMTLTSATLEDPIQASKRLPEGAHF